LLEFGILIAMAGPELGAGRQEPEGGKQNRILMQMELTIDTETGIEANTKDETASKARAFHDAQREQTSILAPLERAALYGFARRMPAWVNSDHLSVLGFIGMIGAGACYAVSRRNPLMLHLVNVFIFLNWFGDSLDGTLARYRDRQRPRYGFYVDHIIDTFGICFLLFGMTLSGYMSERAAAAVLISYFMLAINSYLAAYSIGIFKISQWKLGPTELRLLLMIGNVFLFYRPRVYHHRYLLFDVGGVIATFGMSLMLVVLSIQHTHTLYKLERLPKQ
jgi:archaetidylinositol phosphate synthase